MGDGKRIQTFRPPCNTSQRSKAERGYDAAWRRLRERKLRVNPICEACHDKPAEHVDHIDANTKNREWRNLQSLCRSCHARKTFKHDGGLGQPVDRMQSAQPLRRI